MAVHRALGPGLLESAYEACLEQELLYRELSVARQVRVPVRYRGVEIEEGYRLDLIVADELVVEVKTLPVHRSQLLTYLRMTDKRVGLLFNFNTVRLRSGIARVVHDFPPSA